MAENTDEPIVENDAPAEEGEEEKASDDKDEEVVPVRKSVVNAQRRIIEKQAKQLEKTSKSDESDDDEELTPKARKLIEEAVQRATAPLEDKLAFRDYFATHPEDRKYEAKAKARFDAWGTVPIEEVMKTLRPSVDPEEREKAEDKAKRNSIKGSTKRAEEPRVATTEADYKKVYENVKRGNKGEALKQLGL